MSKRKKTIRQEKTKENKVTEFTKINSEDYYPYDVLPINPREDKEDKKQHVDYKHDLSLYLKPSCWECQSMQVFQCVCGNVYLCKDQHCAEVHSADCTVARSLLDQHSATIHLPRQIVWPKFYATIETIFSSHKVRPDNIKIQREKERENLRVRIGSVINYLNLHLSPHSFMIKRLIVLGHTKYDTEKILSYNRCLISLKAQAGHRLLIPSYSAPYMQAQVLEFILKIGLDRGPFMTRKLWVSLAKSLFGQRSYLNDDHQTSIVNALFRCKSITLREITNKTMKNSLDPTLIAFETCWEQVWKVRMDFIVGILKHFLLDVLISLVLDYY